MTSEQIPRLPPHTQEIARLALELAPKRGFSPWLVLGLAFAESNFGRALRDGTGDFIPRPCSPIRDSRMKTTPLPGVACRTLADGIPARKMKGPLAAWIPTTHGWGVGVFQIDWEAHHDFIKRGTWRELRSCMEYALEVLARGRTYLSQACGLRGDELLEATIASYNAGAGRVAKFIREDRSLDGATFHPGYVGKIKSKADELAGACGAWRMIEEASVNA